TKKILDISLTEKGIQKIATLVKKGIIKKLVLEDQDLYKAKSNTNDNAFLSVKISAKINENAVMGKRIKNNFTLSFSNNPNKITKKKTVPPFELPEVHTGGKRFKKVNDVNRIPLSGAEFALFQDDMLKDQINWTEDLIKMNQSAIKDGKFAGEIVKGQPIILKSNIQGEFEIKGLQYGSKGSKLRSESIEDTKERSGKTTYYLREIVAPSGYVISQKTIVFDVTFDSYYKDPTQVDLGMIEGTATPLEIKNTKRPSIPNTGGIGTAIFIVIGAAVMAFAAKGMKRRSDENE
ncbi:TPA: LPXTG cell wall anchor domain-containing protein, partial [Streptococcus equi subsp. zooepidemicus]|nr:LPXTG cell wall anchor domain-containing protein [Streptococcus equi subsp. zooepidemicus]